MGKYWGRFFMTLLCLIQSLLHSMNSEHALIPANSIDKTRWGAKAVAYGACTIGSGMLLVTGLYDFATNNTPETSLSTRFATIGTALVGLKCFGFSAYKAFRELIAGHSDKEALIQEIIARLGTAQIASARTPEALSVSSFNPSLNSITQIPSLSLLGTTRQGSNQSVTSYVAATERNGIDALLRLSSQDRPEDQ